MNVLYVSSGNSEFGISPIIKNQGESLKSYGVSVTYYTLKGRGLLGYIRNIKPFRDYLKFNRFDIIHAHFSFTAFIVSLAKAKPLVVSLMGWNIETWYLKALIKLFNIFYWDACIVKSNKMRDILNVKDIKVIPNGVNLSKFYPMDKKIALNAIQWNPKKKHILFAANPSRPVKNFKLVKDAITLLNREGIELHVLDNVNPEMMVYYYNAADVVVLSSFAEGSPNVIKEAMACNTPIVSTDVGDVRERFHGVKGCYLSLPNTKDFAEKIVAALEFNGAINSREVVADIDTDKIAQKIIELYKTILKPR